MSTRIFRKVFVAGLAVLLTLILTSCASSPSFETDHAGRGAAASNGWTFKQTVQIVCPWGVGGGAAETLKAFTEAMESEIGVSVVVNYKPGENGMTGVKYFSSQEQNGYVYLLCTQSPLIEQVNGNTGFDVYGTLKPLCRLVKDCSILVAKADAPYNNYEELEAYVKENGASCGMMTIDGLDGLNVSALCGGSISKLAYKEGTALNNALVAGSIDLACVGFAETAPLLEAGTLKVILVFSDNALTQPGFENVSTSKDAGIKASYGPARGIFYLEGTPEKAVEAFEAAAKAAVDSDVFQAYLTANGLSKEDGWLSKADYEAEWKADYEGLRASLKSKTAP